MHEAPCSITSTIKQRKSDIFSLNCVEFEIKEQRQRLPEQSKTHTMEAILTRLSAHSAHVQGHPAGQPACPQ